MNKPHKMISFSAIGLDSPGLVADITSRIFALKGNVVDVEENCRRGIFSIFLIVDFSAAAPSIEDIMTSLKQIASSTGLKVIVHPYRDDIARLPVKSESHLVTIIGLDQPGIIADVSRLFKTFNVNIEKCRMIARGNFFSMEMMVDTGQIHAGLARTHGDAIEKMKRKLKSLCEGMHLSLVFQSENIFRRRKKMVVFDVESSLVQQESLEDFVAAVTRKMGQKDHVHHPRPAESEKMQTIVENAGRLKGLSIDILKSFTDILQLNAGALELIRVLKSMGFKIALLSSGFNFFMKKIFESAGVDYAFSNTLELDENGITTGRLEEPVVTDSSKNEILEFIMSTENIEREQIIAVGDGSQSSHFIENVGLSIAFKPEKMSIQTDGVISTDKIFNVLYCLGIPQSELEHYL